MNRTDSLAVSARAPWHLWVVGVFALVFTLFGAYDFTMSQLADRAYITATVPDADTVDAVVAYLQALPLWLVVVWACGVWSAVGGAMLLVLRSRHAFALFVWSLVGLVVADGWTLLHPIPGVEDGAARLAITAAIFIVMLGLALYARAMRLRNVLQ